MIYLTPDRTHELGVILYVRELVGMAQSGNHLRVPDTAQWVADYYSHFLHIHDKPPIRASTIRLILHYKETLRWEWAAYFSSLGYTAKQIGEMMNTSARTVSTVLCQKHEPNTKTLQRWLNQYEAGNDMYSMQQATQVSQLVIPSRNFGGLLQPITRMHRKSSKQPR